MSFLFASSHLPETRVQRPDELEDEEEDVQPMLHSGGVRAFSHLPAKRVAADSAGPLSQRGAQALGRQFQRTETQDAATPHEDGIAAAKASGVFDVVRQQFNRDDSPHFMDEDGNLRPRQESRLPDSPPRAPRSPQFGAGAPPRPAWSAAHAADGDSSRSPRTPSFAPDDTRPWYIPPITPEDLDSQHHDDDATGSHSAPKGRPELNDLVYRTPGASTPKTGLQDLLYRFNGNPEEAKEHDRGFFQNVEASGPAPQHGSDTLPPQLTMPPSVANQQDREPTGQEHESTLHSQDFSSPENSQRSIISGSESDRDAPRSSRTSGDTSEQTEKKNLKLDDAMKDGKVTYREATQLDMSGGMADLILKDRGITPDTADSWAKNQGVSIDEAGFWPTAHGTTGEKNMDL